jgi:hypothetical protein
MAPKLATVHGDLAIERGVLTSLKIQSLACTSWLRKLKYELATLGKVLLVLNLLNLC